MNFNKLIVRILSCEICGKPSESKNYNVVSCPGTEPFVSIFYLKLYTKYYTIAFNGPELKMRIAFG
ncbi:unnamed protein product [Meloidogyne enterolobii]|uniref:Uncharacterized protein n=1 Tax=Meloidogyne enterolobii TaxID=390850 RepID=A0ACB1AY74_MELEN